MAQHSTQRLEQRVAKALSENDLQKAIAHYEGFFRCYATCQPVHNKVAALYRQAGNPAKAGRHYYFKPDKTIEEQECVTAFKNALGNDPQLILNQLCYKKGFHLKHLDAFARREIQSLLAAIAAKHAALPKFALGIAGHFAAASRK